jgi:hypothetical protein
MADPTGVTDVGGTSADGLSPRVTVGIIVGICGIATVLIMTVLYALMICKYCIFRHYRKKRLDLESSQIVRGAQFPLVSPTSSFTTHQYSHQNSYTTIPYGTNPHPRPSSGYQVSTFDDPGKDSYTKGNV